MQPALFKLVLDRLRADPSLGRPAERLVEAACHSVDQLDRALGSGDGDHTSAVPIAPESAAGPTPVAFVTSLTVEGFRGVGPAVTLSVEPGPGLTVVLGRNGSGKSSLAEGLETLLTGENRRWQGRKNLKEWEAGWRNLHHDAAPRIAAEFVVAGRPKPVVVERGWSASEAAFGAGGVTVAATPGGLDWGTLGWSEALELHRPFLSYRELGTIYEQPSALYDSMYGLLGLGELSEAVKRLTEARLGREQPKKEAGKRLTPLLAGLNELAGAGDERATTCHAELSKRDWGDLDAVQRVAMGEDRADAAGSLDVLRRLTDLRIPNRQTVADLVERLRAAEGAWSRAADAGASRRALVADLLEKAVAFRDQGDGEDCPVCGTPAVLDDAWRDSAVREVQTLREAATALRTARRERDEALKNGRHLVEGLRLDLGAELAGLRGDPLADAVASAVEALQAEVALWQAGPAGDGVEALALHLEARCGLLVDAFERVVGCARELQGARDEDWKPMAARLVEWLGVARRARREVAPLKLIGGAEKWLKAVAGDIRNDRFAPISEKARAVWQLLRRDSNVELATVDLTGTATRRRVELKVTVDDEDGVALGVMSQGELNALGLSLFIPRALLEESPFGFVVIDDPVQAMDPARVEGLARVLEDAGKTRQVIVFTHDDRLFEAIRRLQIAARVWRVHRRGRSVVELRLERTPAERHLWDAQRVAADNRLSADVTRRVVPGLCRLAIEALLTDTIRSRRLGRGEDHVAVEQLIESCRSLTSRAALALFDDVDRGSEVLRRLNSGFGKEAADVYQACNRGSHGGFDGDVEWLLAGTKQLTRALLKDRR